MVEWYSCWSWESNPQLSLRWEATHYAIVLQLSTAQDMFHFIWNEDFPTEAGMEDKPWLMSSACETRAQMSTSLGCWRRHVFFQAERIGEIKKKSRLAVKCVFSGNENED